MPIGGSGRGTASARSGGALAAAHIARQLLDPIVHPARSSRSALPCVRARMRASAHCHAAGAAACLCFGLRGRAVRAVIPAAGRARNRGAFVWYCGYYSGTARGSQRRYRAILRRVHFRVLEQAVPRVDDEVRHACARRPACGCMRRPSATARPAPSNARASSPADPPCGSTVHRRANVRLDHEAEGNAVEPHKTTRQRRAGRRGRAARAVPRLAA